MARALVVPSSKARMYWLKSTRIGSDGNYKRLARVEDFNQI